MKVDYSAISRRTRRLFREYVRVRNSGDEAKLLLVSDQIVEINMQIVEFVLRKFRNRGEDLDDLRQVGMIGLIKAVERFDPARGFKFTTFATATIEGEIRRYFRDRVPVIKIPRSLTELRFKVYRSIEELTLLNGHEPSIEDLALELSVPTSKIIDALNLQTDAIISLDAPMNEGESSGQILDFLSEEDKSIETLINLDMLKPAFDSLDEQELKVIELRFWLEMSQTQIAEALGISQMHVSRSIRRSLLKMRRHVSSEQELRRLFLPRQDSNTKNAKLLPSVSSYGISVLKAPKDTRSLNLLSIITDFRNLYHEDEFPLDNLFGYMNTLGISIPKEILLSFSGTLIFPSRNSGLWRFEPDESPVFSSDVLICIVSNLETLTHKTEVSV